MALTTALNFDGNTKKAIDFYTTVFDYTLKDTDIHYWDNGLVAHAEIFIYDTKLMLADVENDNANFSGFSLSINLTDKEKLTKIYDQLNVDAHILMPLQKTDWSDAYGLLKDQFGVTWQFNLD